MTKWASFREMFEAPWDAFWIVVFVTAERRLDEKNPVSKVFDFVEDTLGVK